MIVVFLRLALVGGDHPTDPDAIIQVVETLVFIGITFDYRSSVFSVVHPEVVVPEGFGAGVCDLKRKGKVIDSVVTHDQIAGLAMEGNAATHAVIAVLVIVHEGVGRVLGLNLVVDADAVAQVADARLHKESTVGVGLESKQLADLGLEMESPLEHGQGCGQTAAANNLALIGGNTLAKDADAVVLQFVAEHEIAIGREQPVAFGFVDEAAADGVGESVVDFGVKPGKLGGISHLEHGGRNGFLFYMSRGLGKARKHGNQCDE